MSVLSWSENEESTMKPYNRILQAWMLSVTTLLSGFDGQAEAQKGPSVEPQQIPSSAVACYFAGRFYLDTNTFRGEVVGYFTDINGIGASDVLFKGSPS